MQGVFAMKDPQEVKFAWLIWNLLYHLNDRLWDRYEQEFLELIGSPDELIDNLVADVKECDLPF
jgi:hypothetical protein